MYCWGRTTDGQLGLGGIEESTIPSPRWNKYLHGTSMVAVGCGLKHTVFLMADGTMYSCGCNETGQLGQDTSTTRPALITALDSYRVTRVACGDAHSVAIDDRGSLYTWGNNSFGQLGADSTGNKFFPMRVRSLQDSVIVEVACGANHTLALSQNGCVFSWGENLHCQLGHSAGMAFVKTPQVIESLKGLPVSQIAAGGAHNLILTRGSYVYGWGRNNFRQIGLNHSDDVPQPTEVESLRMEGVQFISCGDSHTAVLNQSGKVLTFGCASSGQLGHSVLVAPSTPTKVTALMTSDIVQVVCGRMHTLAVDRDGNVYSFGQGSGGQLGLTKTSNTSTPSCIDHDWTIVPPRSVSTSLIKMSSKSREYESENSVEGESKKFNAFITMVIPPEGSSVDADDYIYMDVDDGNDQEMYMYPPEVAGRTGVYPNVSMTSLDRTDSQGSAAMVTDESVTVGRLSRVFAGGDQSFACVSMVPLSAVDGSSSATCSLQNFRTLSEVASQDTTDATDGPEEPNVTELSLFQSGCSVNLALLPKDARVTEDDCHVNVANFKTLFTKLWTGDNDKKLMSMIKTQVLPSLPTQACGVENLRAFYILPILLQMHCDAESLMQFIKIFGEICKFSTTATCLGNWFFKDSCRDHLRATIKLAKDKLHALLVKLSAQLTAIPPPKIPPGADRPYIRINPPESTMMVTILNFLQVFDKWNKEWGYPLKYSEFHEELLFELVDFFEDFFVWISGKNDSDSVVFCQYPFVLDSRAKERFMMIESRIQMRMAITQAQTSNFHSLMFSQMLNDPSPHAYQLIIDRKNLLKDTMAQLVTSDTIINFKKPLVVSFVGEEGEDAGGVKKEFFTLLLQEILSPDFGMFVEDDESHLMWFRDNYGLFEVDHDGYLLIGILCGLAMYNSVITDVPFPIALYKKLLGWAPDLSDLVETFPSLGHSLMDVMNYEGDDFLNTFDLNFTVTRSVFGELMVIDLIKDGANKVVTKENRNEYCAAYVEYTFNSSIRDQFEDFKKGFLKVCDGKVLRMMHPEELKILMVGQQVVNWKELEQYMIYKNGYSASHSSIVLFWEVFHEFTNDLKKKFLMFYTGSNRIPITGVKDMNMVIQRMDGGPKCNKLPVAHTCFNILDLPPYKTKAQMKQKLLQAINFTRGFGIV